MMDIDAIRNRPTLVNTVDHGPTHESIFQAWNILQEVKRLLDLNTPGSVVRELISEMEKKSAQTFVGPDTNVKDG